MNATPCKHGQIMVKDTEHISPRLINIALSGRGKFAFSGSLALSLLFHAALFSAAVLLKENVDRAPRKPAVIEIDLSAIETPVVSEAPPAPAPAEKRKAAGRPANVSTGTARQNGRSAIRRAELKKSDHPSGIFNPAKDKTTTAGVTQAGAPLPVAAAKVPAAGEKAAESLSGAGKEGVSERHAEGSESRNGAGHETKAALAEYSRTVRALIERRKEYPLAARKLGIQGSVVVSFSLDRRGELQGVSLAKSSGNSMLDNAGIRAVRGVGSFPPPPGHAMRGEVISFRIPVRFNLATG